MFNLDDYIKKQCLRVDVALDNSMPDEGHDPQVLHEAMRYSVFTGGKRIRPVLCLAAADAVGGEQDCALFPAMALELLHTYTLIHDDLPSMDDDDTRRGKPASHIKYGEANAVLTGDALQAMAFDFASRAPAPDRYPPLQLVKELSEAAIGVVAGQVEDINHDSHPTFEQIQFVHLHKTALLFRTALRLGAIAGNATEEQLHALSNYGTNIGLAFQVTDDILDAGESDREELSCLMIYSIEEAKDRAKALISEAIDELKGMGQEASEPLAAVAGAILERKS